MKNLENSENPNFSIPKSLADSLVPLRTYREVAATLGVSESAVRQLEANALRKIARAMIQHTRPREITNEGGINES